MATVVTAPVPGWALGVWSAASGHPPSWKSCSQEYLYYWRLPMVRRLEYRRAAELLRAVPRKQPNVRKAATILHEAGFRDMSTRLLLRYGLIDDAADLLLAQQMPLRAAQLYAQRGLWKKAGQIYLDHGDYLRAGHCAVHLGHLKKAARLFRKAGHMRAAAKCYLTVDDRRQAALSLGLHGDYELAKNMYAAWLRRDPGAMQAILSEQEAAVVMDVIRLQNGDDNLVKLLHHNGRTTQLIKKLLEHDQVALASDIFGSDPALYRERLFKWLESQPYHSSKVKELFESSQDHVGLGRLMEYLGIWEQAAEAYHRAGRFESAYECSLKSGDPQLVEKCRSVLTTAPKQDELKLPPVPAVALGGVGEVGSLSGEAFTPVVHTGVNLMSRESARTAFDASQFFATFSGEEKELLWTMGKIKQFRPGEIIVDFEENPEGTITVLSGGIAFEKRGVRSGIAHTLPESSNIGEAWSVLSLPSAVRIYATELCEVHIVERTRISDLSKASSQTSQVLYNRLSDRVMKHLLRRAAEPPIESMPVLAI